MNPKRKGNDNKKRDPRWKPTLGGTHGEKRRKIRQGSGGRRKSGRSAEVGLVLRGGVGVKNPRGGKGQTQEVSFILHKQWGEIRGTRYGEAEGERRGTWGPGAEEIKKDSRNEERGPRGGLK